MTNEQKYKTAEERVNAFMAHRRYKAALVAAISNKFAHWLALEAEEEKLEPCPFCGGDCSLGKDNGDHLGNHEYWVDCEEQGCYYRSGNAQSASDAIAAHNHMARAVRAGEKGEVK